MGPGGFVQTSYLGVLGVELCALGVVGGGGLVGVGAEGVLVEGVDLDGGAEGVGGAEVWGVSWGKMEGWVEGWL